MEFASVAPKRHRRQRNGDNIVRVGSWPTDDFSPALKRVEGVATCRLEVQGDVIYYRLALRCEQLNQGMSAVPQDATNLQ